MRTALILAAMAMGTVALAQSPKPVRNPIPPGKGVIAGRVTDAASKAPLSGARVRLQPRGKYGVWAPGLEADPTRQITTGAGGEFRFTDVGPVEYDLIATRDGYSEGGAGKTWAHGSHAPIQLEQDQSINPIEILLWPVGQLTGRVVDERGMPVAGVQVRANGEEFTGGTSQFTRHVGSSATDERGEYRFTVQPPGRVIVCVDAIYTSYAIPPLSPNQRRAADSPGLVPVVDASWMLISPDGRHLVQFSLLPPPAGASGELEAYVSTCAPAVTSSAEATVIDLKSGSTAAPDLSLRPRRASRISGRLIGPGGPVGQTWLRLVPTVEDRALFFAPAMALTAVDGTFSFLIVPPGSYTWEISVPDPPPTVTPSATGFPSLYRPDYGSADPNGYWIAETVEVGAGDIENLTLTAIRGVTVTGTIAFEGAAPPTPQRRPSVSLKTPRERFGSHVTQVTESGKFEIQGVKPGRYGLEVSAAGFTVVEMTNGANDLIDGPLVVGERGVSDIAVRVTSQPSSISGVVRNTNALVVPNPTVVIFPADSRAWKTYGREALRIRSTRGVAGRYTFTGLPPGDYRVAAIDDSLMARWLDPALFASIEPSAQRVALQPGEQLTINLVKR